MQTYQTYEYDTGLETPTKIEDWAAQTLVQLHLGCRGK